MTDDLALVIGLRWLSGWTAVCGSRGIERRPSDLEIANVERSDD